jgi:3'-5' exoribonuclease
MSRSSSSTPPVPAAPVLLPPGRSGRRKFITELPPQGTIDQVFLATHKQLRPNRNGQLYLQVELADRSGLITARMWNAGEAEYGAFEDGDYVRVEGSTQLYQGNLQVIATSIQRVDPRGIEESDYRVLSGGDIDRLVEEMRSTFAGLSREELRLLADAVFDDERLMESFRRSPAGVKHHHAYAGGLIDHVASLLRLADRVATLYPDVDRDLLLVGVLFHDIGKTVELESEKGFSYTDSGQLLGHVLLGLEILDDRIAEVETRLGRPLDAELAVRIKHMVASHHGHYEFGSPKLPMTLEAIALHHLDHFDAQMASTLQLLQNEASMDSGWTQYHANHGRKFFRGRERSQGEGSDGR